MTELTGKRLGEAVLREVMGYKDYAAGHKRPPLFDAVRQKGAIFVLDAPELRWRQWTGWNDKNDMWEVVEKMAESDKDIEIVVRGSKDQTECAIVDSTPKRGPGTISYREWANVTDDSACEAVLRAALKATRAKEN
jgi:hypothetical protein